MTNPKTRLAKKAILPGIFLLVLCAAGVLFIPGYLREQRIQRLLPAITEAAENHRVDPALVMAVIRQESDFKPHVLGQHGEVGLMQITEGAASDWARVHRRQPLTANRLFDEQLNLEIGVWYLSRAMDSFNHHNEQVVLALSQYNAGRSRALKWEKKYQENIISQIPFPSTRSYIKNIVKYHSYFQKKGPVYRNEN